MNQHEKASIGSKPKHSQVPEIEFLNQNATRDEQHHRKEESRTLLDRILSPKALQRMMLAGGSLLVIGMMTWLWTIGVFENPLTLAFSVGTANLLVLLTGTSLLRWTQHQLAGNGLSFLALLAMPLNLWIYNAQGLITIADGGHLWIPAAIITAIYSIAATILRKPLFVYTLVGGLTLTGLLFLADQTIGHFWELQGPVILLVSIGWACIYSQRLFPKTKEGLAHGDFSRERFGNAFRLAGTTVLTGGLLLLIGGQANSLLFDGTLLASFNILTSPTFNPGNWTISILIISGLGCLGEYLSNRNRKSYLTSSMGLFAWGALCAANALSISPKIPHLAIALGIILVITNIIQYRKTVHSGTTLPDTRTLAQAEIMSWSVNLLLILVAVLQVIVVHSFTFKPSWFADSHLLTGIQLAITAIACWTSGLVVVHQKDHSHLIARNLASTVAACLLIASLLTFTMASTISSIDIVAILGILACIAIGIFLESPAVPDGKPLPSPVTFAIISLLGGLLFFAESETFVSMLPAHCSATWILATASIVCFSQRSSNDLEKYIAAFLTIAALYQALEFFGWDAGYSLPLAVSVAGLALTTWNNFSNRSRNETPNQEYDDHTVMATIPASPFELPGNLLALAGTGMSVLFALFRFADSNVQAGVVAMLGAQLLIIGATSLLTRNASLKQANQTLAFVTFAVLLLCANSTVNIGFWHRVEAAALLFGGFALALGHIGWLRERQHETSGPDWNLHEHADRTSAWLVSGSLLVATSFAIALIHGRATGIDWQLGWDKFHELGAVAVSLGLFATGVACRIRSTTLAGAGLLLVYIISLLALVQWPEQLKSVSVVMMIGGGIFFATAVLLSIYRDRIAGLPGKFREKRGIFRVMKWR